MAARRKVEAKAFETGWAKCSKCGHNVLPAPSSQDAKTGLRYCTGTNRAGRDCRPTGFTPAGVRGKGTWKATEGVPGLRQVKHGATDAEAWSDWDSREDRLAKARAKARTQARTQARKAKA
jgi:hypothetical protein